MHNLLGNAVKFTDRGLVRLTARVNEGEFIFEVSDTGPGIASKDMDHIFEASRKQTRQQCVRLMGQVSG
jgi:signal transduction histidine kinase